MMAEIEKRIPVGICESQPVTAEGLRTVFARSARFCLSEAVQSLEDAGRLLIAAPPRVMLLDKAVDPGEMPGWLRRAHSAHQTAFVVWGVPLADAEALGYLRCGARGVLRKTADAGELLACLDAVAAGGSWVQEPYSTYAAMPLPRRHDLTVREQQVLELVERGLRNKQIADELGIRPGTVKIHLKHVFEKTGIHGRYGLALSGLRYKTIAPALGKTA